MLTLFKARIYEQEDNNQQAYLLLMRYATLVTDKLPFHPSARDPENQAGLKAIRKTLPGVLDRLEILKPTIDARYNRWQKSLEQRREASTAIENDNFGSRTRVEFASTDPAVAGNTTTLAAGENSDLAVRLAHKEIRRRETKRRATRQAGVSETEEQERRTAGLWDDWEAALSKDGQPRDDDELQSSMEATRRRMDGPHDIVPDGVRDGVRRRLVKPTPRPPRPTRNGSSEYRYPSIPKSQPFQYEAVEPPSRSYSPRPISPPPVPEHLPPKPPKQRFEEQVYEKPPSRPEKVTSQPDTLVEKPNSYTFRPSAYLENGNPLRTVFLPPTLREKFLQIAAPNTRNNLETCGMLCGTLISNALFIQKVVIPEQESTSDTCETINESAFFDYCANEDLMVLGWIHTHPSQTCFMSSRDLHTHCGYQIMMPESIAIVCAPSKNPS